MTATSPAAGEAVATRGRDRVGALLRRPITHPAALIGLALAWSLLAWLRLAPSSRGAIWAEDGRDFLADAVQDGPLGALLTPYAGYMHLLPRMIAGLAVLFPVDAWAQVTTALSCLAVGLIALLVYTVTARLPLEPWARILLASITVLAPTLVAEVLGNAANMYTFVLWAGFWLFLFRPRRWWSSTIAGLIMVVLSGTAVQLGALLPLLLVRRSRRSLPLLAGYGVGACLQLWALTHSTRSSTPSWPALGAVNDGYLHQVALGSWLEAAHAGAVVIVRFGWLAAAVALVPYAIAVVALWRSKVDRPLARTLAVAVPVASWFYWFALFSLNDLAIDYSNRSPVALVQTAGTIRYAVFPAMLLWALLVLAIGWRRPVGEHPVVRTRVRAVAIVILLVFSAVNFVGLGVVYRSQGPEWSSELDHARSECRGEGASTPVSIPIAPVGAPWTIGLSCGVIQRR